MIISGDQNYQETVTLITLKMKPKIKTVVDLKLF